MIAACIITFILACAYATDDSTLHRVLIGVMWLAMMLALAFPTAAEPSPSAYVPPFTPMPSGAPPEIRCWQPKSYIYPTGTTSIALVSPVWCCYEWRANVLDQRWAFLQCVK